jgi:hypothetical protein
MAKRLPKGCMVSTATLGRLFTGLLDARDALRLAATLTRAPLSNAERDGMAAVADQMSRLYVALCDDTDS